VSKCTGLSKVFDQESKLDDFVSSLSFPLIIDLIFFCPDVLEEFARQLLSLNLSMPLFKIKFRFQFMVNAK